MITIMIVMIIIIIMIMYVYLYIDTTHIAQKSNIFTFQHMGCSLDHNKETCHTTEVLLHERGGYMEGGHMEQRLNRAEAKLRAAFGA